MSWWHRAWLEVSPPSCLSGGFPHLARVRTPRTPVARVADGEGNRLTWSESLARGSPSPAERQRRVCSEKSEHSKIPRRRSGARVRARCAKKGRQISCRWGCKRRTPLPVSPRRAARRPSCDASFSEACGADRYWSTGKKVGFELIPKS